MKEDLLGQRQNKKVAIHKVLEFFGTVPAPTLFVISAKKILWCTMLVGFFCSLGILGYTEQSHSLRLRFGNADRTFVALLEHLL